MTRLERDFIIAMVIAMVVIAALAILLYILGETWLLPRIIGHIGSGL
jgi:hypothetical protein